MSDFKRLLSECRQAYAAFRHLASRTDEALYEALGQVHTLRFQMRDDGALRTSFDQLLQEYVTAKAVNETLFLVKYAFFPNTVQPGPGNKADITKASRYAKLINKALDRDIEPADFLAFARAEKIQSTATTRGRGRRRSPPHRRLTGDRTRSSISSGVRSATFLPTLLKPLNAAFADAALGTRMADVQQRAGSQPVKLTATFYLDQHRAVVTGLNDEPWMGDVPGTGIRIPEERTSVSAPPRPVTVPEQPQVPSSRFPPHIARPRGRVYGTGPWRPRSADGLVWPKPSVWR